MVKPTLTSHAFKGSHAHARCQPHEHTAPINNHAVLGVNDWHADVRQRFTVAHELGHLKLHHDELFVDGVLKRDDQSSLAIRPHEIEANA